MRAIAVLALALASACSADEHVIDAAPVPIDAPDAGPIDGPGASCPACGPDQVCVAFHDGTCSDHIVVECQDRNPGCSGPPCAGDRDCQFWHCTRGTDAGYICYACPNDVPGAINCHGP